MSLWAPVITIVGAHRCKEASLVIDGVVLLGPGPAIPRGLPQRVQLVVGPDA